MQPPGVVKKLVRVSRFERARFTVEQAKQLQCDVLVDLFQRAAGKGKVMPHCADVLQDVIQHVHTPRKRAAVNGDPQREQKTGDEQIVRRRVQSAAVKIKQQGEKQAEYGEKGENDAPVTQISTNHEYSTPTPFG